MTHLNHPTIAQLANYLDGLLIEDEIAAIETHLATQCAVCETELAWLKGTMALMGQMGQDEWADPHPNVVATAVNTFSTPRPEPPPWSTHFTPRRLATLASVAVLFILILGLAFFLTRTPTVVTMPVEIMGQVEVFPAGKENTELARLDSPLGTGDTIRTGNASSVVLPLFGSETELGANTELLIDELETAPNDTGQIVALFQMMGYSRYQVADLPSADSRFVIRTPAGLITAQSANFTLDVNQDGLTELFVVSGFAEAIAQDQTVRVPAGQTIILIPGQPPATPTPVPTTTSSPPPPAATLSPTTEPTTSTHIQPGNWFAQLTSTDAAGCIGLTIADNGDRHQLTFALTHNSQPHLGQATLLGQLQPQNQFTLPLSGSACLVTGRFSTTTTLEGTWQCTLNDQSLISGNWTATPLSTICQLP